MTGPTIDRILTSTRAVLFDFDGPLCHVFAGLPAARIARELAGLLDGNVITDDPLEVLSLATRSGPSMVKRVEDALIASEVAAIESAQATPGGIESVLACLEKCLPVGIVSNNSALAITGFLKQWKLEGRVHPLVGRTYLHPELMKPNTQPLEKALRELGRKPSEVVYIGDSDTDIEVAAAVGVPCIGYANKPGKRERFAAAGVTVIETMRDVAAAVEHAAES
jgi:HAD superfamily hydrolase (TIGR01549 family)